MGRIREYAALSSGDPRHHRRGFLSKLRHVHIPGKTWGKIGRVAGIGALAIPGLGLARGAVGLAARGTGGLLRGGLGLIHRGGGRAANDLRAVAREFGVDAEQLEQLAAADGALGYDDDDGEDYGDPWAMGDPRPRAGRSGARSRAARSSRSRPTPARRTGTPVVNRAHLRAIASRMAAGASRFDPSMAGYIPGVTPGRAPAGFGGGRKHRRMNATNVRALRRAMRRVASFDHLSQQVGKELSKISRKAHHGHAHIPAAHHRRKK